MLRRDERGTCGELALPRGHALDPLLEQILAAHEVAHGLRGCLCRRSGRSSEEHSGCRPEDEPEDASDDRIAEDVAIPAAENVCRIEDGRVERRRRRLEALADEQREHDGGLLRELLRAPRVLPRRGDRDHLRVRTDLGMQATTEALGRLCHSQRAANVPGEEAARGQCLQIGEKRFHRTRSLLC